MLAFGAPGLGAGYMYLILSIYVMKFSTDVLLIAPYVMGIIFSISRLWDAVSDPLAGYLSDRTTSRLGRRRTWMLASLLPIGIAFLMVFAPPPSFSGDRLVIWMAVAVIGFYSAMTLFFVPHLSLGAELSDSYHERSRLFGVRHAFYTFGSIISLVSMQILINAEQVSKEAVRDEAFDLGVLAVVAMGLLLLYAVFQLRERTDFQGRVTNNPFHAYRDVWRNQYARLLIVVTFIEQIGSSAIAALTLYIVQYVVGAPQWGPAIILAYMIPSSLSVPLWIPLSRKIGKVRLWLFSMLGTGLSFGGMFALIFLDTVEARLWLIFIMAVLAGTAAGAGGTISPSIQGDVIDYDEYLTGERKEGSYFAAWNFVYKAALGVMLMLTGYTLQLSGFEPNVEQSDTVKLAMVSLYGLFPLVCYLVGAALFTRFKLDEATYGKIREELDRRAAAAA